MVFLIEGRIVKLGNSMAISVKKKDLKANNLKLNQRVRFSVIKPNRDKLIRELFGLTRGAKPFVRDESNRVF